MPTAVELSALRARTQQLLMSPASQNIDFYWGGNHVSGSTFVYIAVALASRPNTRRGISFVVRPQPPNVGASYQPANNTVEFPTIGFGLSDPWEKMSIIHEMTHAVIDEISPGRRTRAVHDELCAYTAGALFNIYSAGNPHAGPYPFTPAPDSVYSAAHGVAMSIQDSRGFAISPVVANPLRQAILASPTYTYLHAHPNYSYSNNGVSL
jgi:hypothetical protein